MDDVERLESRIREEEMRVTARLVERAQRGATGRPPDSDVARLRDLEAEVTEKRRARALHMRETRAARRQEAKRAKRRARDDAKLAALQKRGPHLRYLINFYRETGEPDMVAKYEAELADLPGAISRFLGRRNTQDRSLPE